METKLLPPKEKANKLVRSYIDLLFIPVFSKNEVELAKKCALLEIEGIRESWTIPIILTNLINPKDWENHVNKLNKYWDKIELEINEL